MLKTIFTFVVFFLFCSISHAETIGIIKTSGIFIKDSLEVLAFDDPTIKGITCYVTAPQKALSFTDPSNSSISCRKVGKVEGFVGDLPQSTRNIFSRSKNLFFKKLSVDRIYDAKRHVLVYVSYTKKLTGDNASNSVSVVVLD